MSVLIVAECNVNEGEFYGIVVTFYVLIVAECNVNFEARKVDFFDYEF